MTEMVVAVKTTGGYGYGKKVKTEDITEKNCIGSV